MPYSSERDMPMTTNLTTQIIHTPVHDQPPVRELCIRGLYPQAMSKAPAYPYLVKANPSFQDAYEAYID